MKISSSEKFKQWKLFFLKCKNDWTLTLSSMLAFHLLMALLPLAMVFVGVLALFLGHRVDLQNRIENRFIDSFPPKVKESLKEIFQMAWKKLYNDAPLIVTLGVLFAIFSSSRLFIGIDRCLTIIYRLEERKCWKKFLLALKMLLIFLVLIPLMIFVSSLPSIVFDSISSWFGRIGSYLLGFFTSLLLTFVLFELIYFFIPNRKMTLKTTYRGSIVAAGVLQICLILFPVYLRFCLTSSTGQIGFFLILIFFLFLFALILVIGAQINAFFLEKIPPFDVPLGTLVSRSIDSN